MFCNSALAPHFFFFDCADTAAGCEVATVTKLNTSVERFERTLDCSDICALFSVFPGLRKRGTTKRKGKKRFFAQKLENQLFDRSLSDFSALGIGARQIAAIVFFTLRFFFFLTWNEDSLIPLRMIAFVVILVALRITKKNKGR